jgi:hypothetical protein
MTSRVFKAKANCLQNNVRWGDVRLDSRGVGELVLTDPPAFSVARKDCPTGRA